MAIYSLNLRSIGRTTHAAGTAGAHLLYIARPEASPVIAAEHMPSNPVDARTWMNQAEAGDRKNARVLDKVRIALPRELTPEQRLELVRDFARELTGNRVPWFAAIHATGKDALNPHCHLVLRDRDIETGKRVLRLSDSARDREKAGLEPKAVEWVRLLWEQQANRALERAGHDVRIDRRTLEAQGIDRAPTIHIGPQAAHVEAFVDRPRSKVVETGTGRMIDYPQIDGGKTRTERHAEIVDFNLEKAARSPDFRTRETAKFERAQIAKDRALEKRLIAEARERTREARQRSADARKALDQVRHAETAAKTRMRASLRADWGSSRQALTERHRAEREALDARQGRFVMRLKRVFDLTGRTRKAQDADREALQARQKAERAALVAEHRTRRQAGSQAIAQHLEQGREAVRAQHYPGLSEMAARHRQAERDADRQRQERAAEREKSARHLERVMAQIEQANRAQERAQERGRGRAP